MKIKQTTNGIDVLCQGQLILRHSSKKPAIFVGVGMDKIISHRGNFQIEDYIEQRIGLDQYIEQEDGITFFHNDIQLDVQCNVNNGRNEMTFHCNKEEFNRFWIRIYAEAEETVYGCGEQASYFNLRGRHFPLWTSEPGVGRDKNSLTTFYANLHDQAGGDYYHTYYPEPTFVSSRKYWLHADTFAYADFDFRHDAFHELFFWNIPQKITLSFERSYLDLIEDLTDFTGRSHPLPEYLQDGIILGVQGGTKQIRSYLNLAQKHGIKVNGLWCQDWAGHMQTTFGKRLTWNWILNQEEYPNLQDDIVSMEQEGVHFLGYVCPFLLVDQSLYREAEEYRYLVLNQSNEVYRINFGEFLAGGIDLTNPDAVAWFKQVIQTNIIDTGMKGWMADFGEYLPVDAVLHNNKDAKEMHNEWPVLWAKLNYELVEEANKVGEVFYFMRSGAHGSQKYATALWAGDQSVNWEIHDGIPSVIPSALSTGIIGNPFTHSDIGGYTSLYGNIRTKELFERWLEMSVFTAIMRTHEGNRPTENFQFYNNPDTMDLMAKMTTVRSILKPYIAQLFEEGHTLGYPVQRPIFLHYENDELLFHLQFSYMFGADVLVHPVIKPDQSTKTVYLPDDEWIHLWTGLRFTGNRFIDIDCPIGQPPVFYRKDSKFVSVFEQVTAHFQKGE